MPSDYDRVAAAIRFLSENVAEQPGLRDVAAHLGMSPFHCQRLFRRWAGVSPKRFLEYLTVEHAKRLLGESRSVLDAAIETGLSGPGRLHDHFVTIEGVTPGEYKSRGAGLEIAYGVHDSPVGPMVIAVTERGICGLAFADPSGERAEVDSLRAHWSGARFSQDRRATRAIAESIFARGRADRPARTRDARRWTLLVRGTNFQINVWKALLRIPDGAVVAYEQIARAVGCTAGTRAVAAAIGANRVGFLIPCHRVIRSLGETGGYRWGETRKRALLVWESSHHAAGPRAAARVGDNDADARSDPAPRAARITGRASTSAPVPRRPTRAA